MADSDPDRNYIGTYLTKFHYDKFTVSAISRGVSRCKLMRTLALDLINRDDKRLAHLSKALASAKKNGGTK
jgi:hypothetical protein